MRTYLYIYENTRLNTVYIGVAGSMDRVWQAHNQEATSLLHSPGTQILQTIEPFTSRADALKAEAVAIHIAALGGRRRVLVIDEEGKSQEIGDSSGVSTTNRAGTKGSKLLGPAIFRREGEVSHDTLRATFIVTISGQSMDDRPAPYGGVPAAAFSERARKWWPLAEAKRNKVERLIAVLRDSGGLILGDWDVDPTGEFESGEKKRVALPLVDADLDDPREVKGKRLVGYRSQGGPVYSPDLAG